MRNKMQRRKISQCLLIFSCILLLVGQVCLESELPELLGELTKLPSSSLPHVFGWLLVCIGLDLVFMLLCSYFAALAAGRLGLYMRDQLAHTILDMDQLDHERLGGGKLADTTLADISCVQSFLALELLTIVKAPLFLTLSAVKLGQKPWLAPWQLFLAIVLCTAVSAGLAFLLRKEQRESVSKRTMLVPAGVTALALLMFPLGKAAVGKPEQLLICLGYGGLSLWATTLGAASLFHGRRAYEAAHRLKEMLNYEPHLLQGNRISGTETGTLEFCHVSFRYPGAAENALTDISFKLRRGQALGIIGEPGSGKSTLLNLAARLYDVTEGEILLDGVNIKEYRLDALYDKLGYSPQKKVLFSETVEANVNLGDSDAVVSEEQTWLALSRARANEYVEVLPGKLHQQLPAGGSGVPEAEIQKLSIARVLARNPEIVMFDEAIPALDEKTAELLRAGLADDLNGVTKLIAGCKIQSVKQADELLLLEQGKMIDMGTHEQLLQRCPAYRQLVAEQDRREATA